MKKIIILFFAIATLPLAAQTNSPVKDSDNNLLRAALKGWHVKLSAGFNIGGSSPMPLPQEIRAIDSYNPTMCISIEGLAHKRFEQSRWGMALGVRLETKGMKTDATVKNYHMEAVNTDGSGKIVGAFTGHVKTNVSNKYLSFPILATYTFKNERWQMSAGPYFAWMFDGEFTGEAYGKDILDENGNRIGVDAYIRDQNPTGEKTEVSQATYNFSKDLRRFHWGVQVGGEFKAYKHLAVFANLQWGLNGIFPSDFGSVTFDLYPIYGNIGFTYLF
ncbi:MAG: PorT family protein [Bacteroidaceae bacterium]|nr:PorT family protein [Bacteroidaceae bacterium]